MPMASKTILIIDDDRDLVQGLRLVLEGRGYRVVTAFDGAGRVVGRAAAPADDARLDVEGEASFRVNVGPGPVERYQVRFETPFGPLAHVDRRPATDHTR